ncbi:MAG: hypothetical protein LBE09_03880 [Christensenellaceae bacterium]|jgi:hypothetical protein|nr:hypothetical protein [Christensenellaceae bacterium]
MLIDRFKNYIEKETQTLPDTKAVADFKAELLDTLMSRAEDIKQSNPDASDAEIYTQCIGNLGDYSETLRSLSKNPIDYVRDTRLWRKLLYCGLFSLLAVIIYITVAYTTDEWGLTAIIIFATLGIALLIYLAAPLFKRGIKVKNNFVTALIISGLSLIAIVALYCGLSFGIDSGWAASDRAWSLFPFISPISFLTFAYYSKRYGKVKISERLKIPFVMSLSVAIYLLVATILDEFHPYWIIVLAGAAASIALVIKKMDSRIENRKQ